MGCGYQLKSEYTIVEKIWKIFIQLRKCSKIPTNNLNFLFQIQYRRSSNMDNFNFFSIYPISLMQISQISARSDRKASRSLWNGFQVYRINVVCIIVYCTCLFGDAIPRAVDQWLASSLSNAIWQRPSKYLGFCTNLTKQAKPLQFSGYCLVNRSNIETRIYYIQPYK